MNKRGNAFSIIIIILVLVIIGMVALYGTKLTTNFGQKFRENGFIQQQSPMAERSIVNMESSSIFIGEAAVLLFLLVALIGLGVAAVKTDFEPFVVFLFFFFLIIAIVFMAVGTNIYRYTADSEAFADTTPRLVVGNHIFTRYAPTILFFIGVFMLIMMYSRQSSGGQSLV